MSFAEISAPPARMHLVDLTTGEDKEAMFNPGEVEEALQVVFARHTVPGLSHQPLNFVNTGNHGVSFDLYMVGKTPDERTALEDWRRFLLSLCYPKGDAGSINDGAPPRVLFVWPRVWTLTCQVQSVRIVASEFTPSGQISRLVASVSIEEIRDGRLTSDDVRRNGTRRSTSSGGESA